MESVIIQQYYTDSVSDLARPRKTLAVGLITHADCSRGGGGLRFLHPFVRLFSARYMFLKNRCNQI